jgi:hypothetical protein
MVNITYGRWEKLSEESQNNYIKSGMLPDVPWADMENDDLFSSRMIIKDGERCWEIRYRDGKKTHIFPEVKQRNILGISMLCKFNPMSARYSEPPIETKLGYYGTQWLEFMENHYPKLFRHMTKNKTLYAVAQSVNERARNYKNLLDKQYEQLHPRPPEYMSVDEIRSWKFTRNFYTDHEVMVERVLIPLTSA